jgi:hypothetical protein
MREFGKTKCTVCGWPTMRWGQAQWSYGRLIGAGLTIEEAKRRSPICRKCTTRVLQEVFSARE